jgi:hypothetical protein
MDMIDPDQGLSVLSEIYTTFGDFCQKRGQVTEADTRAKVIDRILKEALGWPEDAFSREVPVHQGYLDYLLTYGKRNLVLVEAKREGIPFEVPKTLRTRRKYKISGSIKTNSDIKEAIEQAHGYCIEIPVRYAVTTNGYAWLVFRAIREDIPWREGYLIVFESAGEIKDHFTEFWNLLSYPAVLAGSLDKAFSLEIDEPRLMTRPLNLLRNPNAPLLRNKFHVQLHPFIEGVFRDIGAREQLEIIEKCYVHSKSLRIVDQDLKMVIEDSIPQFIKVEGAIDTKPGHRDAGPLGEEIKRAVSKGEWTVFLLLGGIGSGKTTYLNRFFRYIEKSFMDKYGLWYYVDFLAPPGEEEQLDHFVKKVILNQLREKYSDLKLESRESLILAYDDQIKALKDSILDAENLSLDQSERRLNTYLERWIKNQSEYITRIVRMARSKGKTNVVCIDNVDQLSPTFQVKIFHLAQRLAKELQAVVVVALREESYYSANIQRAFTAYNNRTFHIASPPFRKLISLRLKYCREMLTLPPEQVIIRLGRRIEFDKSEVSIFFDIIEHSIFSKNKNIARFIESLAFGNMREALDMFSIFLYSGATNVDKMLKIYDRDGNYFVPFHEFAKSVILGDRRFYLDSESKILNLFDCGQERNASHFTSLRLLAFLLQHINESSPEGRGFTSLEYLYGGFLDLYDNEQDLNRAITHLLRKQLIQINTRSLDSLKDATHIRISSAGWYYFKYLVRAFAYLDLVFQDTPIDDQDIIGKLKQLIIDVDEIVEKQEFMLERMELRFERVEMFLSYLLKQEQKEQKKFSLNIHSGPLGQEFMLDIITQYEKERDWIKKRISEKAERQADDSLELDRKVPVIQIEGMEEEEEEREKEG